MVRVVDPDDTGRHVPVAASPAASFPGLRRDAGDSLNARGAQFTDLISPEHPDFDHDPLMTLYAAVTRIAILAAAHELRDRG